MDIPLATLHPDVLDFDAVVTHINDDGSVELDRTYFYPGGGGQPCDTGTMYRHDEEYLVSQVLRRGAVIAHTVHKPGLVEGDGLHCRIDEKTRHIIMRMHTAAHVLCAIVEQSEDAQVTGNQIGAERTRIDFSITDYDQTRMLSYFERANALVAAARQVKRFISTRDELLKHPRLVKLAMGFPGEVTQVHMVEVEGLDLQPCGGTHVENTVQIGKIIFERSESRGRNNRRVYFHLE